MRLLLDRLAKKLVAIDRDLAASEAALEDLLGRVGAFVTLFDVLSTPYQLHDSVDDQGPELAGYSKPFSELPVLSVLIVTVSMTAPMTAWMLYRGMPRRIVAEMSATNASLGYRAAVPWLDRSDPNERDGSSRARADDAGDAGSYAPSTGFLHWPRTSHDGVLLRYAGGV